MDKKSTPIISIFLLSWGFDIAVFNCSGPQTAQCYFLDQTLRSRAVDILDMAIADTIKSPLHFFSSAIGFLAGQHKLEELPTHLYMSSYVWLHNSKKNQNFRNIFTLNATAQCFSGADFNVKAHKGKQMLPGGSKTRSALQSGYFDQKFNRIMEGEAFTDPVKHRRQDKLKSSKLNLGKAFVPSSGEKLP